ncbi:putative oxidoreductase YkpB [Streptomyces camponoticapitis]|uniref:2-dehydropantoate 2-reductase n=1 Tax=Streptomyces camponoticapitis TaxID=1616125 RepID=A0ABQ2E3B8_9ACTN|nr:2-dehydropantoate 2-reductase [Streptomyces camponoticapitis]GGJ92238.1 putative oxidoreductase YkpB [Streptomyces camponoticapitis]
MKILVVGAGAVGGFVGGRLVGAGREVDFLVRAGRAAQLRERGLRIVDGAEVEAVDVSCVGAGSLAGPYGLILLSVKPAALSSVMDDIEPAVERDTAIVPFLNGMAHVDLLTGRFGDAILGGVLKVVTQLDPNGDIRQFAPGGQIQVGELDGAPSGRVTAVTTALSVPGFTVTAPANIVDAMWSKWVMIATIGAVTTLVRGPIGGAVAVRDGAGFAAGTLEEAASIAAAAGHPVGADELDGLRGLVTAEGSSTTSSLSRELVAGRETEVENVLGDLIDRAAALGLTVPRLEAAALTLRAHNARVSDARS